MTAVQGRTIEHACHQCSAPFTAKRADAVYCSAACRKRASRGLGPQLSVTCPAPPSEATAPRVTPCGASEGLSEASQRPTSGLLRWLDKRFFVARKPDGIGWQLYLPIDKLLVELNWALRQEAKQGRRPMLPIQTAASLTALLLAAGVDPEFPLRLPLGGPEERWADPMYRSGRAAEAEMRLEPLGGRPSE
jgi:hypothetical protein